jgi:hypothetical protein
VDYFCGRRKKKPSHAFCPRCQRLREFAGVILRHGNIEHHLALFNCGAKATSATWTFCGHIRERIPVGPPGRRFPGCPLHSCYPCEEKKIRHDTQFYVFIWCCRQMRQMGVISQMHFPQGVLQIIYRHYQMQDILVHDKKSHYLDDKPSEYRALHHEAVTHKPFSAWVECPMDYRVCQAKPVSMAIYLFMKTGVPVPVRSDGCQNVYNTKWQGPWYKLCTRTIYFGMPGSEHRLCTGCFSAFEKEAKEVYLKSKEDKSK